VTVQTFPAPMLPVDPSQGRFGALVLLRTTRASERQARAEEQLMRGQLWGGQQNFPQSQLVMETHTAEALTMGALG
jgi:hypothetical protein